jgi:predicted MPP superfamily phosphohydrolase
MTGDFVNNSHAEIDKISYEISKTKAKHGVYGCLGNHDHFMTPEDHQKLVAKLKATGMKLLINENETINLGDGNLHIAAIDNIGFGQQYGDYSLALKGLPEYEPIILLAHDPTNWDKSVLDKLPVDLTLAGHTHGGQVGIELFGKMLTPVKMVYKYWAGLYKKAGQYLYVNRGVGMTGPPIRLGIKPEISLITLKKNNLLAKN